VRYFVRKYWRTVPVERGLSLGCGGGNLERGLLLKNNAAARIDAYDASTESIRLATQLAADAGLADVLHYAVADINTLQLPETSYDFAVAKMSLHHFDDLDHVYAQVRKSLKPHGVFVFNEFVGPDRFQWTDAQLDLCNQILNVLPKHLRISSVTGRYLDEITRPTVAEMCAMDPTEAVHSSQILPLLSKYFEIVEIRKYGGTLLHLLLNHVMANFDTSVPSEEALLRLIFAYEKTLHEKGVLESDFCFVVARPLTDAAKA